MKKSRLSADDLLRVEEIARRSSHLAGPLMPVLHQVQGAFGFIPSDAVPVIARVLNLSRAEVHGVITFYRDLRTEPGAIHTVRVCRTESCQAMGGEQLCAHIEGRLGTGGRVCVDSVYCLGNCALSPSIMVDGRVFGRVTAESFDELLGTLTD